MPGLLDNINNPWMALGAGLLQAGGPHLDPSKASLGAGLTSGLNAISAQQQMQFKQALLQQQQEQAAAKQKADWAKVQEKQAEAGRLREAREKFQTLLGSGDLKGAAVQATFLGEGGVANKLLDSIPGQNQYRFDGKSIPGQQMNAVMDGLVSQWRSQYPDATAEDEELIRKKLYFDMSVRGLTQQKQTGATPSGLPIYSKPSDLPTVAGAPPVSGGAQGATGVSPQQPVSPFPSTPAPVGAPVPGLTDGGAGGPSPRVLAQDEVPQDTSWQGAPLEDPEHEAAAQQGLDQFQQKEMVGAQILARKEASDRLTPSEVAAIDLPPGSEVTVVQDLVTKKKHFKVIYKGQALTENERKQSMQLILAKKALDDIESFVSESEVDPGTISMALRRYAAQAGGSNIALRAILQGGTALGETLGVDGIGPGDEITPQEAALMSRTQTLSNVLLALYRGAQVGPLEQARFDQQLPMIGQNRELFKQNIASQRKNMSEAIRLFESRQGKRFAGMVGSDYRSDNPEIEAVRDPSGRPVVSSGQQGEITVDFNSLGIRR